MAGRDYNKVTVTGRLGADPEMRFTPNGVPVASFRMAVNRPVSRTEGAANERRDDTDWFNVVAWQRLAEFCNQYLTKGRRVLVEGRLQTRSWEGQDGQRRYATEIIASEVLFLDSGQQQGGGAPRGPMGGGPAGDDQFDADDLPF